MAENQRIVKERQKNLIPVEVICRIVSRTLWKGESNTLGNLFVNNLTKPIIPLGYFVKDLLIFWARMNKLRKNPKMRISTKRNRNFKEKQ